VVAAAETTTRHAPALPTGRTAPAASPAASPAGSPARAGSTREVGDRDR